MKRFIFNLLGIRLVTINTRQYKIKKVIRVPRINSMLEVVQALQAGYEFTATSRKALGRITLRRHGDSGIEYLTIKTSDITLA